MGHTRGLRHREHTAHTALKNVLLYPALEKAPRFIPRNIQVHFTSLFMPLCLFQLPLQQNTGTSESWRKKLNPLGGTTPNFNFLGIIPVGSFYPCVCPACIVTSRNYFGCETHKGLPQTHMLVASPAGRQLAAVPPLAPQMIALADSVSLSSSRFCLSASRASVLAGERVPCCTPRQSKHIHCHIKALMSPYDQWSQFQAQALVSSVSGRLIKYLGLEAPALIKNTSI